MAFFIFHEHFEDPLVDICFLFGGAGVGTKMNLLCKNVIGLKGRKTEQDLPRAGSQTSNGVCYRRWQGRKPLLPPKVSFSRTLGSRVAPELQCTWTTGDLGSPTSILTSMPSTCRNLPFNSIFFFMNHVQCSVRFLHIHLDKPGS